MHHRTQHIIDLVVVLTHKEMKVRYKNNVLGYLWSIVHPLAFAFVLFVAFKVVMRIDMENYTLFLIAGLFPWQWFSNSVMAAPTVFLNNASIIKKVNFPRSVVMLAAVLQDAIHYILSIPVIVLFLFIFHQRPSLSWLWGIPMLMAIQFLMTYGVSLLISSINLFFRDLERLTGIIITFMFYLTPIIYPETMIPENYRDLINLNPLSPLMISWRKLFLEGTIDPLSIMTSFVYALVAAAVGHMVYKRLVWKFAEVL